MTAALVLDPGVSEAQVDEEISRLRDKFNDKYVIIIGTFNVNEKGHMRMFGGTLDDIVRLDLWDIK